MVASIVVSVASSTLPRVEVIVDVECEFVKKCVKKCCIEITFNREVTSCSDVCLG
jgi:hypothetical protein